MCTYLLYSPINTKPPGKTGETVKSRQLRAELFCTSSGAGSGDDSENNFKQVDTDSPCLHGVSKYSTIKNDDLAGRGHSMDDVMENDELVSVASIVYHHVPFSEKFPRGSSGFTNEFERLSLAGVIGRAGADIAAHISPTKSGCVYIMSRRSAG
eukprot:m.45002 g.45002  ORF g.45002 m.45002 type:complete len:154 (-) comp10171_c0_seq1:1354-1815(-)